MDKQQLLGYFQDHYLSRQDVLYKLPLNISIDSFWQDLVNQRKARATMLPLYSATGQPYWFVTTDKMVKASERLCEEAMKHDSFFDPYRIPLSQALTSALSQEAYFTSFVEGADYPIQAAVDFLRRGSEPENAYEQNIMNNYQAGSYLLSALSIPFDEGFVKELAAKKQWNISKVKTVYDCCSFLVGVGMSFAFFGMSLLHWHLPLTS